MATRVKVEIDGAKELDRALRDLVPQIRGQKGFAQNPLRTAVRKATVPIMERASKKVRRFDNPETERVIADNIDRRLISTRERDAFTRRGDSLEGYDIGYLRKVWYAGFLELGSDTTKEKPFLRPALDEAGRDAIKVMTKELKISLDRIAKKLARQK